MAGKERVDEIAAELGAPPRPADLAIDAWLERVEDFCPTRAWSGREILLIEEMRQIAKATS
jgi:hypothetical protein